MEQIYFSFPGNEHLTASLSGNARNSRGIMDMRRFPDGESYLRIQTDVCGRHVILVCSLDKPDEKIMPLCFFSKIVRTMNAAKLTLIAPYLAYMRQDKVFHPGEGISSVAFAKLISTLVDEIVTIDPHLHRFHSLSELYPISTIVRSSASSIAAWIAAHVQHPFIIGPDSESEQWVKHVAAACGAPYAFFTKTRFGDKDVRVAVTEHLIPEDCTPVLVDDIISSGRTMIETTRQLLAQGLPPPVCVGVHGIFAGNAYEELKQAGAREIVTTNTILHSSNQIDISGLLLNT